MAIIEPVKTDAAHPHQVKRYSAPLRLWHWLNLIVITGSLLTVLLNSTITSRKSTAPLFKKELTDAGATVTDGQVRAATHALSDSVWDVHVYFGYALSALLLFRLLLEIFQLADQKFIRSIKKVYIRYNVIKKSRETARHDLAVKSIYAVFYLLLIIMVVTGLSLAFEDALAFLKPIRHNIKDIHGFCMYLILAFITVHLAGVFLAERKNAKGIVSDMINGGNDTP